MAAHLDQNATTAVSSDVLTAMLPWLVAPSANPSAGHRGGRAAAEAVEAARGEVARLFGARSSGEVVFTSGGTESIHTALAAALAARPERRRIVTSTAEHSATRRFCEAREAAGTHDVVWVPVDRAGRLEREALFAALDPSTACVTLLLANNETGVISDLAGVDAAAAAVGAAFHIDAVQAPGKLPLDVRALGCDLASISGHKLHAPRGTGALYVREGFPFTPTLRGGPQERERRAGTENVPGIVGLGVAARVARARAADPAALAALAARRDRLERGLLALLPGARVHGAGAPRVPNTLNIGFQFPGGGAVDAQTLLALLDEAGVEASAGSACSAQRVAPSTVLLALGCTPDEASSALRFSLAHTTSDSEIDAALAGVSEAIAVLAALG